MNNCIKILIVEDEVDISEIIKINLESQGHLVDTVESAEKALETDLVQYDLYVLDIMLENMTGIELAKIFRSKEQIKETPIIFLTAKNTEQNKLDGFEVGADDYITKPFSVKEFIARVRAVLSRTLANEKKTDQKITLDDAKKIVIIDQEEIILTKKEYLLLNTLINNQKMLFSRDQLLDIVWKDDGSVTDRAVDVMIRRLRKKLGNNGNCIKTRSGLGYSFDPN